MAKTINFFIVLTLNLAKNAKKVKPLPREQLLHSKLGFQSTWLVMQKILLNTSVENPKFLSVKQKGSRQNS